MSQGLNYLKPGLHALTVRFRKEKEDETIFKDIIVGVVLNCAKDATVVVDLWLNYNKNAK